MARSVPRFVMDESGESYLLVLERPGGQWEIDVRAIGAQLTITRRRYRSDGANRTVSCSRELLRPLALPDDADPDKVSATVKGGVLLIVVQRHRRGRRPKT